MADRARDELLLFSDALRSIRGRKKQFEAVEAVWPDIEDVKNRVQSVSKWERAITRPSPELLTEYLDAFARDRDEWVRIWKLAGYSEHSLAPTESPARERVEEAAQPAIAYWLGRPTSIGDGFVGRDDELEALSRALSEHRAVVVSGSPGTGKSRLAAEYAHTCGLDGFWADAGSDTDETLTRLALPLNVEVHNRTQNAVAADVERALVLLPADTLLIIDNLADLGLVSQFLKVAGSVRLLITTRDSSQELLGPTIPFIRIQALELASAVVLLCSRAESIFDQTDPSLTELAEEVGRLPLALEMLAVHLGEPIPTPQKPQKLLEELYAAPSPIDLEAFLDAAGTTIPRVDGVYAALTGALSRLPTEAREQLAPLGYLADAPISVALAKALTGLDDSGLSNLLVQCSSQSIMTHGEGSIIIHALTTAAIAATNDDRHLREVVRSLSAHAYETNEVDPVALRTEVAHYERAHALGKTRIGAEDSDVLTLGNWLAITYRLTASRMGDELQLFEEILLARERVLGPDHQDTFWSRNDLGVTYRSIGRAKQALQLFEQNLSAREHILGYDHPDTLVSRNNLAISYRVAGRASEALRLDKKTLARREYLFGHEDHDTLVSRNNLAIDHWDLGRRNQAFRLFEETQASWKRLLGPENPKTLQSQLNLAEAHRRLGRVEKAIVLHERTLAARERVFGREDPATISSRSYVALSYQDAGRMSAALQIHRETVRERERVLGPDHRATLESLSNLATAYAEDERIECRDQAIEEAIKLFHEVRDRMLGVLGPDDPTTLAIINNLAKAYRDVGFTQDSIPLFEQALAGMRRVLGPTHPYPPIVRANLISAYRELRRGKDADRLENSDAT